MRNPLPGRCRRRGFAGAALIGLVGAIVAWCSAGSAGAAITTFTMAPNTGPPGTVVHVSGAGCTPGLLASSSTDFVAVTATFGVTVQAPVTSRGSWQGSFAVPSGASAGSSATVAAICVSSSLQSLLTIYTPQQFSVTAPSAPTTTAPVQTPTTVSHPPKGGSGGPVVGTTPGGKTKAPEVPVTPAPTLGPGLTVQLPGDTVGAVDGGAPDGSSTTARPVGTAGGAREVAALGKKHGRAARAATLQPANLGLAASTSGTHGLGWLGWLLLAALAAAVTGALTWLRRSRRDREVPDSAGAPV